ncbi:phage antirepressor KilAC domain-containing protein [Leifsonia sp. NPDC058194]|uniref:phage antirepressor KilAC domain-containing protein n=1 Tax=Leifsonia sp. NPDC058194 TaxID=3346374 RepID=UPI0036DBA29A
MPDNVIVPRSIQESLDSLKIITLTDGEVWSARDLMPYAGYERWERFSDAITRAIASVDASGLDASEHFRGAAKSSPMPNGGTREIEDVQLTRYGCYILLQNADARKPEVARAQQYFAIQTRTQELSQPAFDPTSIEGVQLILAAAQTALATVKELEAKVQEDAPKVEYVDNFLDRTDVILFKVAASELGMGEHALRSALLDAGWITRRELWHWSEKRQKNVREYEYFAASAHRDKFKSKEQLNAPRHHNGQIKTTLYIYPAALPAIRRRLTLKAVAS